jgi:glutamyl-tRNA synthetase
LPPVYDRASLGKKPNLGDKGIYYRFKINYDEIVSWQDKLRGDISIDLKSTSDPIILRENGIYTYMLPSVIDDMDYKITSILRGEDHITNTAIQIQMLKAIGAKNIPEFIHVPILRVKDEKMSKRSGGWDLQSFRSNGIEPEAIANYLVNLGSNLPVDMCDNILQSDFDIKNYSSSSAMIDEKDILRTNKKFLQNCNFADIKDKINLDIDENFWNFVKGNIEKLSEIKIWKAICSTSFSKPKAQDINTQLIKDALSLLPKKNISDNTYKTWVDALAKNHKYSKKEINMSIRMSLTNMRHGPELGSLLPIIGLQEVIRRLKEQIE